MRNQIRGILTGLAMVCAGVAQAQTQTPKPFSCGDIPNPNEVPKIEPIFHPNAGLNDSSFDCMAWQDFIFLNWPAMAGERGVPNKLSRFGAAGPTVWETYRTADTVFLPDAANPGPWDQSRLMASVSTSLARQVASGSVRHLTMKSKVSSAVMANILRHGSASPQFLDEISQAGGGTLYDLNGYPVYYEVSMDKAQYDYIVNNGLYNANTQITFAQKQVISLPAGSGANDTALELKAAWKVLSEAERNSGRFHTIQALLDGSKTPVTVGLVGFHMFISNGGQGAWATFAQMDDAPAVKPAASGAFSFFNPKCTVPGTTNPCPFNIKDANPGQVVQITPNDNTAEKLNDYVHALLKNYNPKTPWQYYNLVDVQWATQPVEISKLTSPAAVPLPDGKPNRPVVVNPVLETFVQSDGIGCFSCHTYATVAASGNNKPNFASSYSFTFGRAATPKQ